MNQLRAENERLAREARAYSRELHEAMVGALRNPHLKAEAPILVRALVEAEARWQRNPSADAWVVVPLEAVADPVFVKPDEPLVLALRHRTTIARHLKRGHDWGLLERAVDTVMERVEQTDPETGAVVVRFEPRRRHRIRRGGDLVAALRRVAEFRRPEPSSHGAPQRAPGARRCRPSGRCR